MLQPCFSQKNIDGTLGRDFMSSQIRDFERQFLFHGTIESFDAPPEPGGDKCFWVAEHSAIAQSYIPVSGGELFFTIRRWDLRPWTQKIDGKPTKIWASVRPTSELLYHNLFAVLGWPEPRVERDKRGIINSWWWPGDFNDWTYVRFVKDIKRVLGYRPERIGGDLFFRFRTHGGTILPAGRKIVGRLFVFAGKERLNLVDVSRGESDLTDLQYHYYKIFEQVDRDNRDGVVIDDFLQSKRWGNVGHRSICLTRHGLTKLSLVAVVPATNFDPEADKTWLDGTPEFRAWASAFVVS